MDTFNNVATYIVAFNNAIDDINNLLKVIRYIKTIKDVEFIIIEYGTEKTKLSNKSGFIHIELDTDARYFSRSRAWNIGWKYASNEIVIFSTCNDLCNKNNIYDAINLLNSDEKLDMCKPYDKQYNFKPGLVDYKLANRNITPTDENSFTGLAFNDIQSFNVCDGVTIFKKKSLAKIYLWDEIVSFWKENDIQTYKVKKYLTYKVLKNTGYKLHFNNFHNDQLMSKDITYYNQLISTDENMLKTHFSNTVNKLANLKYNNV